MNGSTNDLTLQLTKIRNIMEYEYRMKVYKELVKAGVIKRSDYCESIVKSLRNYGMIDKAYYDELIFGIKDIYDPQHRTDLSSLFQ